MFARIITLAVCTLISSVAFAQAPAASNPAPANRCAVAKSTTFETTADGRTVIVVKTVQVCK